MAGRAGNFTSSAIYKLMTDNAGGKGFGKPALTYIEEKAWERELGRSLSNETTAKETSWGHLCEIRVFELLPINYIHQSDTRYEHPTIEAFTGAPDMLVSDRHGEIKCPFTLKSFMQMRKIHDLCEKDLLTGIDKFKKDKPEWYYQLVSNFILLVENGVLQWHDSVEIIYYVPFKHELKEIRESVLSYEGDQNKFRWLDYAGDSELPWLLEDGKFKNLNQLCFKVPDEDIEALTNRVKMANDNLKHL